MGSTQNAKYSQFHRWAGMGKKTYMSIANTGTLLIGMVEIRGSPFLVKPQTCKVLLIALKSCNRLHPPELHVFSLIANTGVLHELW